MGAGTPDTKRRAAGESRSPRNLFACSLGLALRSDNSEPLLSLVQVPGAAIALRHVEAPFAHWLHRDDGRLARLACDGESFLNFSAGHRATGGSLVAVSLGEGDVRSAQLPRSGRPDARWFGDRRAISVHPASNLRRDLPVHWGGRGGALVLEQRFVGCADSRERGDTNLLRGTVGGGPLS